MPLVLARIGMIVGTSVSSFFAGTYLDFSEKITWMYTEPSILIGQVFQQPIRYNLDDYFIRNVFVHKTTIEIIDEMTLEEKIGQLVMPAWEKGTSLDEMVELSKKYKVGGVMVLRDDASVGDVQVLRSALGSSGPSNVHPFVAIDAEPSLIKHRIPALEYRGDTNTLDSPDKAYQAGSEIAQDIKPYGYNLNFAPIYDSGVNTSVIGNRAFGTTEPDITVRAGAFTRGLKDNGVIATAKHFPGHGYVQGDTHQTLEFVPGHLPEQNVFEQAIKEKIPVIMVGHLAIEGGQYDTNGLPATVSQTAYSLLRDDLDFRGLIITDAMNMGALNEIKDVDIRAIESGADMILMPRDIEGSVNSMIERARSDESFREDINEKVYRIVRLKLVQRWMESRE